jgi:hypothetical protein
MDNYEKQALQYTPRIYILLKALFRSVHTSVASMFISANTDFCYDHNHTLFFFVFLEMLDTCVLCHVPLFVSLQSLRVLGKEVPVVWGSGSIAPHVLNLDTTWMWVVSFMLRLISSRVRSPRYPLYRRMDRPQSRSGPRDEEKIFCPCRESYLDRPL